MRLLRSAKERKPLPYTNGPARELTSATTGETIGAETASTLPLSTRNFLTLLTLSAGANTELFDSAALGRVR